MNGKIVYAVALASVMGLTGLSRHSSNNNVSVAPGQVVVKSEPFGGGIFGNGNTYRVVQSKNAEGIPICERTIYNDAFGMGSVQAIDGGEYGELDGKVDVLSKSYDGAVFTRFQGSPRLEGILRSESYEKFQTCFDRADKMIGIERQKSEDVLGPLK